MLDCESWCDRVCGLFLATLLDVAGRKDLPRTPHADAGMSAPTFFNVSHHRVKRFDSAFSRPTKPKNVLGSCFHGLEVHCHVRACSCYRCMRQKRNVLGYLGSTSQCKPTDLASVCAHAPCEGSPSGSSRLLLTFVPALF
jgi:hypothetical protein